MARMRILTAKEKESFDNPPLFDYRERRKFLDFPKSLLGMAETVRRSDHRVCFLVSCGYFRACGRFFSPADFHRRDMDCVSRLIGVNEGVSVTAYSDRTRQRHQKKILEHYGFKIFDDAAEAELTAEINAMARTYLKPRAIFDRCVESLERRRIAAPRSGTLLESIRSGLQAHKAELSQRMESLLADEERGLLDGLFDAPEDGNRYRLTLLKKLSQSSKPKRIKECVADFETIADVYGRLESTLSDLDLGTAGVRYYAGSVLKSEIFQIRRRESGDRHIHAAAFVAHQFYRMQDNLVDLLLSVMASFRTAAAREHKEILLQDRKNQRERFKSVVEDLDASISGLIREIRSLTDADDLSDARKVAKIRAAVDRGKNGALERFKADLYDSTEDRSWYEVLEARSLRLQSRVAPLLKALDFEPNERAKRLIDAVDRFKAGDGAVNERSPKEFLEPAERKALTRADGTFRPSLYKVLLFRHVVAAIKSGDLNLSRSYKYRPMEDYLIDARRWKQDKRRLLERAGLEDFADPDAVLKKLDDALAAQYRATNDRACDNQYLKFRADGSFHVATPAIDDTEEERGDDPFPERRQIPLAQVLQTVDRHCRMLDAFGHWRQTHVPRNVSRPALLAAVMGLGCSIGVPKMARISSRVTESEMENAVNWRFSLENVRAANDAVLAAMDKAELPNIHRRSEETLHTASDGQKFEVRGESLHASRSFKYFGQGQGVSAYSFIDERNFLWHSLMISAADRESAYVIDGLMHNDVVKSDIHSTDTHGYTEAVFGLTHLLGFSFAPRIKGVGKQRLYAFAGHGRSMRKKRRIAPKNYVNETLIRDNWDDLLRLAATVKLKESTASDIFRRLNSYSRSHALYGTLKAFGQIVKSLFILRYLDDVDLRQAIERQLNKIELANRFTRAVAVGNPRGFDDVEKDEQEIAESCNRLIKNAVICWNYLYLAGRIEKAEGEEAKENLRRIVASRSPMSWAHVNMLGEYDFSDEKLKDEIGVLPLKNAA